MGSFELHLVSSSLATVVPAARVAEKHHFVLCLWAAAFAPGLINGLGRRGLCCRRMLKVSAARVLFLGALSLLCLEICICQRQSHAYCSLPDNSLFLLARPARPEFPSCCMGRVRRARWLGSATAPPLVPSHPCALPTLQGAYTAAARTSEGALSTPANGSVWVCTAHCSLLAGRCVVVAVSPMAA